MSIYFYVGALAWVPFLVILIVLVIRVSQKIRDELSLNNTENKNHNNYNKLEIKDISKQVNYRSPKGNYVLFKFNNVELLKVQQSRVSKGSSAGGFRIPFTSLSFNSRKYFNENQYVSQGESIVTISNKKVRIESLAGLSMMEYDIKLADQIRFGDNNKTVHFTISRKAWPIRLAFNSNSEAVRFIDASWTIFNYTPKKLIDEILKKGIKNNFDRNYLNKRAKALGESNVDSFSDDQLSYRVELLDEALSLDIKLKKNLNNTKIEKAIKIAKIKKENDAKEYVEGDLAMMYDDPPVEEDYD